MEKYTNIKLMLKIIKEDYIDDERAQRVVKLAEQELKQAELLNKKVEDLSVWKINNR